MAAAAMTLAGVVLAFLSMIQVVAGNFSTAVWLLFAATMADLLDGTVARALGAISPFGQELDSLADVIAAGVAPAFLIHQVYFADRGTLGALVAAAWIGAVACRLARFNVAPAGPHRNYFVGIPCPIAATLLCHYLLFSRETFGTDGSPLIIFALVVVLGGLMLSTVPYWKSTTLLPHEFWNHPYGLGTVGTAVAAAFVPNQTFFVILSLSIVAAIVGQLVGRPGFARQTMTTTATPSEPIVLSQIEPALR